jgi:hypothetical protein
VTSLRPLIAALLLSSIAHAQKPQPPAPPQLSPKAAYTDAMHPLEVTRHSIANWSDIEIDALKIAIANAATACAARSPKTFSGETLIDLAHLCALGQSWPAVVESAGLYIAADTPTKPLLTTAYAVKIDAELHTKDEANALTDSLAMLQAVPYDSLVAETVDEAIDYMQFLYTAHALRIDALRQPLLLAKIRATQPTPDAAATNPPQSTHELYATGTAFAALQQLANKPDAAAATIADLDATLPTTLTPDDTIPIAAARKRYAFLGRQLPNVAMLESLSMPNNKLPQLPAAGAITARLIFPDTCAQCLRMGSLFPPSVFLVNGHEAYLYGMIAEVAPQQPKPAPSKDAPPPRPTPREILAETPTIVVPASVLTQFAAEDFPFLIVADSHGIVRLIQPADYDVVQSGGALDSAIALIAETWPAPGPKPASTPAIPPPHKP